MVEPNEMVQHVPFPFPDGEFPAERSFSIAQLATLPPGHVATRSDPGDDWVVSQHEWPADPPTA